MFFNFKSYNELITFAKSKNRYKGDGTYYELHHIIPKHCGGTDNKTNLVLLTLGEHIEAHYLYAIEHKNNPKTYLANLRSVCLILGISKSYIEKQRKDELEKWLQNDNNIKMYKQIKLEKMKHYWVQKNYMKPRKVTLLILEKLLKDHKLIENCPICHKENSEHNFACCKEHENKYIEVLKQKRKIVISEKMKLEWKKDQSKRIKNIGKANKISLKGKVWVHNDKEAFTVKNEELDNYLSKGYKLGRIDKIEKVILTPEEKFKKRSEQQLKVSEKKKETWKKKGWTIEDSKKLSEAVKNGFKKKREQEIKNSTYSPLVWIHTDTSTKRIKVTELNEYLKNGWKEGRNEPFITEHSPIKNKKDLELVFQKATIHTKIFFICENCGKTSSKNYRTKNHFNLRCSKCLKKAIC